MTAVPAWFTDALAAPSESFSVVTPEVRLACRGWGLPGDPLVLLVHGGAAHGGWWHHVAPALASGLHVVTVDLSGHGDSGWAKGYSFEGWADEVLAVVRSQAGGAPAVVVGHSMGGMVALTAAARHGKELRGVVCVDLPDEVVRDRQVPEPSQLPVRVPHATRDEATARFRVRPQDPACLPFVKDHVAALSVRRRADGWSWKFDPTVTTHGRFDRGLLGRPQCPVSLVAAERGLLTAEEVGEVRAALPGDVPTIVLADCGHHAMLDQPRALAAALVDLVRGVLSDETRTGTHSCVS